MEHALWSNEYSKAITELIPANPSHQDSARAITALLQRGEILVMKFSIGPVTNIICWLGLIRYKDLSEDPKRFFDAHKLLVENGEPNFLK